MTRRIDWDSETRLGTMDDEALAALIRAETGGLTTRGTVMLARKARDIPAHHPQGTQPGAAHPRARFTTEQVAEILRLRLAGWEHGEIAALVSEPPSKASILQQGRPCAARTIGKICRRERYADE